MERPTTGNRPGRRRRHAPRGGTQLPRSRGRAASSGDRPGGSAADTAEDGEGVVRHHLVHELAARLDLSVQCLRELLRLLPRRGADEDEAPAAHHLPALPLESVGEGVRLLVRGAGDADLPGRVAVRDDLLLPPRLGRLVVPALLVREPVLDAHEPRLDARLPQLRLDDVAGVRCLVPGRGVDEERVALPRDGEPLGGELVRELARAGAEVEAEPLEEAARLLVELDPDPPVVAGHAPPGYLGPRRRTGRAARRGARPARV